MQSPSFFLFSFLFIHSFFLALERGWNQGAGASGIHARDKAQRVLGAGSRIEADQADTLGCHGMEGSLELRLLEGVLVHAKTKMLGLHLLGKAKKKAKK